VGTFGGGAGLSAIAAELCHSPYLRPRMRFREIVRGLEVQPELRGDSEGLREKPRRLWRHPALPFDDLVYALDRGPRWAENSTYRMTRIFAPILSFFQLRSVVRTGAERA
jgi:hypothetical protein